MKIAQYFACKLESKKHSYQKLLSKFHWKRPKMFCHLDFIVILCEKFVLAFIWNNASKLTVRQNGWHALCFWGFSAVITNASEGGLARSFRAFIESTFVLGNVFKTDIPALLEPGPLRPGFWWFCASSSSWRTSFAVVLLQFFRLDNFQGKTQAIIFLVSSNTIDLGIHECIRESEVEKDFSLTSFMSFDFNLDNLFCCYAYFDMVSR